MTCMDWLKEVVDDLCISPGLYFHFTVLTKLTCQKSPHGSPPHATVGDKKFQETSLAML